MENPVSSFCFLCVYLFFFICPKLMQFMALEIYYVTPYVNIRYGENGENWLSNDQLYEVTKQTPSSKKISERRLRFFGHICRLPQNTPARLALSESFRPTKQPKGRPQTTYLSVLRNQLKDKNIKNA